MTEPELSLCLKIIFTEEKIAKDFDIQNFLDVISCLNEQKQHNFVLSNRFQLLEFEGHN